MVTALELLKAQLKDARESFEGTLADVKQSQLHQDPGGKALTLGSAWAHLVFSEDVIIQKLMQGKSALWETTWQKKHGASQPMPAMDDKWELAHAKWAKTVKIDLKKMKQYQKAVFRATKRYVDGLKPKDLEKKIDLGSWGKKTVADMLSSFIIGHSNSLTGEISCLKGLQGLKGYPF